MPDSGKLIIIEESLKHLSKDFAVHIERQNKQEEKFEEFLTEFKTTNSELLADLRIISEKLKAAEKTEDHIETRLQKVETKTQANDLQLKWALKIAVFLLTPLYAGLLGLVFMLFHLK